MRALEAYNREHEKKVMTGWRVEEVQDLKDKWFGSDGNNRCLHNAVLNFQIGFELRDKRDARKGDFIQFWRFNGSGHSVLFDEWILDKNGNIAGLQYWSTQKSTTGIGIRFEPIGGSMGIDFQQIYIVRIGLPSR